MIFALVVFAVLSWQFGDEVQPPAVTVLGMVCVDGGDDWVVSNWIDADGVQRVRDMTTGEIRVLNVNASVPAAPEILDITP